MPDQVIHPSFKLIKAGYTLVVLLIVGGVIVQVNYLSDQWPWLPVVCAVLLLWPVQRHIRRSFTKVVVEGGRLRWETGFLSKSSRTIQLSKVQNVCVDQTLGQRILGIGDISIETAGESRLVIANIDQPQELADRLMEAAGKADAGTQRRGGVASGAAE